MILKLYFKKALQNNTSNKIALKDIFRALPNNMT